MDFYPKSFIAATEEYATKERHIPAPYFRKKFLYTGGNSAKIRICGLGFYELYLNGKNITKGRLAPYITNPDQSLYYDEYDVTDKLTVGENVVGVWLGNGMQNAVYGEVWDFDKADFRSAPKFAMVLTADGTVVLESDESFLTRPSPITFDDLRTGERYDARLETAGWNLLSIEEEGWKPAVKAVTPKGEAKLTKAEPILVVEEWKPRSVVKTPSGKHLYDFGEIFTGVCRLKIQGERGQTVKLTHGEIVIDGELDMRNVVIGNVGFREGIDHCDWYTLKGDGVEIYAPRFTYHGFQYVSVEGLTDKQATLDALTFEVMHSAVGTRGNFRCSDDTLNALQACVRRSDLSNLFYIPTDCPQREKNGWTGDIALSAEQMLINFTVENIFSDWLFSVRNAQDGRGAIPGIVPTGGWGFEWGAGPNWDDALIELPYQTYRYTGDIRVVVDNLPAMGKYLAYMRTKRNEDGLLCYGLGDWAQPNSEFVFTTPEEVTDSIKCVEICDKVAKMSALAGNIPLCKEAESLGLELRTAFQKKYIREGRLTVSEQTALACAIYYQISRLDEKTLQAQLLEVIGRDGGVFTTGILGARTLFRVLSEMGESELAYTLITQQKFPSYAYNLTHGAKTMFEWFYLVKDGVWLREDGRQHDSLNHHFWGDISAWFTLYVAGIRVNPDLTRPDYVEIAPNFLEKLTFAEGDLLHRRGKIFTRWERQLNGNVLLSVRLPEGVEGCLRAPKGYTCDGALHTGEQRITFYKS